MSESIANYAERQEARQKKREDKTAAHWVKIAVIFFVLNLIGSSVVGWNQRELKLQQDMIQLEQKSIRQFQREGRERSWASRATVCRTQLALGIPLDPPCHESGVLKYFDPEETFPPLIER